MSGPDQIPELHREFFATVRRDMLSAIADSGSRAIELSNTKRFDAGIDPDELVAAIALAMGVGVAEMLRELALVIAEKRGEDPDVVAEGLARVMTEGLVSTLEGREVAGVSSVPHEPSGAPS